MLYDSINNEIDIGDIVCFDKDWNDEKAEEDDELYPLYGVDLFVIIDYRDPDQLVLFDKPFNWTGIKLQRVEYIDMYRDFYPKDSIEYVEDPELLYKVDFGSFICGT